MNAKPFSYQCGAIVTHTPWFPPDPEFLNHWRDEFFQHPAINNYTFWLCGGVMEAWATNDIDIVVTGAVNNYDELDSVLTTGMQLGFKHRQFIDFTWCEYYKKFLLKGSCSRRAICCEHYYEHDWCTLKNCMAVVNDVEMIIVGNEVIKNDEIVIPYNPNAIQLSPSLWKIKAQTPSPKQVERIGMGQTYHYPPIIITPDLDFKTVIDWP